MVKGLIGVFMGVVVFIAVDKLVSTLIVGTDIGSVLIQSLLGLVIAIGVVIFAFTTFLKGGKGAD